MTTKMRINHNLLCSATKRQAMREYRDGRAYLLTAHIRPGLKRYIVARNWKEVEAWTDRTAIIPGTLRVDILTEEDTK